MGKQNTNESRLTTRQLRRVRLDIAHKTRAFQITDRDLFESRLDRGLNVSSIFDIRYNKLMFKHFTVCREDGRARSRDPVVSGAFYKKPDHNFSESVPLFKDKNFSALIETR